MEPNPSKNTYHTKSKVPYVFINNISIPQLTSSLVKIVNYHKFVCRILYYFIALFCRENYDVTDTK
jgi:hypothetical protein